MKIKLIVISTIIGILIINVSLFFIVKTYAPNLLIPFDQFGHIPLCNRNINRAIIINGFVFPLCARCTFMGIFFIISLFIFNFKSIKKHLTKIKFPIMFVIVLVLTLPLAIDGIRVYFTPYEGTNVIRMITGTLFGIGGGMFTQYCVYFLFERTN